MDDSNVKKYSPSNKSEARVPTKFSVGMLMEEKSYYSNSSLNKKREPVDQKQSYSKIDKIDFATALVFFFCFIVFNCGYFFYYM